MDEQTEIQAIRKLRKHFAVEAALNNISIVKLLGVHYAHLKTGDGGDLYITKHGLNFIEHLKPESWYEREWFRGHRERLNGTSTVYKVATRPVHGRAIDLVVKWSRVGQDVPLETKVIDDILSAEFNSPFEEFALVEEMRIGNYGPPDLRIYSQRPMAIYVPPERLQLWQTGRVPYKVNMKIKKHPGVEIDLLRQYILIYEWIKGVDAAEAFHQLRIPAEKLHALTYKVQDDLRQKGFWVADFKPAHIIIRKRNDGTFVRRHGEILYGVVDFELLTRTPEHEAEIQKIKRADYLLRQRDRFAPTRPRRFPPYLKHVNILGVDYTYGHVESTGGELWVVGLDPDLFDYFQPERWRKTQQIKLSDSHQVYYTQTKDNIHLVWKTSRVGEIPEVDPHEAQGRRMIEYGYNSPFEEFSYALTANQRGVPTTYPRAIYMTGPQSEAMAYIQDRRRYESHKNLLMPDGRPLLRPDHDYIKIWGFWNGPDEVLAEENTSFHRGVSALQALREGLMSESETADLIRRMHLRLAEVGFESINLTSHHLLLTCDASGRLVHDADDYPEARLCNFEMMRPLGRK